MAQQKTRRWDILDSESLAVEHAVEERELVRRAREGKLKLADCIRRTGTEAWRRVDQIPQLAELVRRAQQKKQTAKRAATPPPAARPAAPSPAAAVAPPTVQPPVKEVEQGDGEAISFREPRTADVPVDLTPMVDVTFQLLLFFMLTATFTLQKSIELPTPSEEQGTATIEQLLRDSIIIEVDDNNVYWVDDQKVDAGELVRRLTQIRRRQNKTSAIVIGSENAHHAAVVTALDAAQQAGIENIMQGPPRKSPKTRVFFGGRRRRG